MRRFVVYAHPRHGLVRVKRGFCWPAFFLGSVWAAARRALLPIGLPLLAVELVIWFLDGVARARLDPVLVLMSALASLAVAVARGVLANRWLERVLRWRGYVLASGE